MKNHQLRTPSSAIGIDMGQTLTKIAYIEENDNLGYLSFRTQRDYNRIIQFLKSKINVFDKFHFTGGRSFKLHKSLSKVFETKLIGEFIANTSGIQALYSKKKGKSLPDSLIVSIGTGTSMILKKQNFQHLGGTAIGGGTFMALSRILFKEQDFAKIIMLANQGNRYNVDLKVSDIYETKDGRVEPFFREFTAVSLGKFNDGLNLEMVQRSDVLSSFLNMIGENIALIACQMAQSNGVQNLIFCGGFLRENRQLKSVLKVVSAANKKRALFLKNSEYCGAIGALIS